MIKCKIYYGYNLYLKGEKKLAFIVLNQQEKIAQKNKFISLYNYDGMI